MTDDPVFVSCCHCRQCQKMTGSAFAINGMIEAERLEILDGKLSNEGGQGRCTKCNTLLWASHRLFGDNVKFVRLGTLDEAERIKPDAHFFTRTKHSWVTIPDGVPTFDALPKDRDPPLMSAEASARFEAARGR